MSNLVDLIPTTVADLSVGDEFVGKFGDYHVLEIVAEGPDFRTLLVGTDDDEVEMTLLPTYIVQVKFDLNCDCGDVLRTTGDGYVCLNCDATDHFADRVDHHRKGC